MFWNEQPSFNRNILKGQRSFLEQHLTFDHLYLKNEITEDHSKHSKVDNLNFHQKRSFIDQ